MKLQISAMGLADGCCMGWIDKATCTCGVQARRAGHRTVDGVTRLAFDVPHWARETTRLLDGLTAEHYDPAEPLLNDARARLELMHIRQSEEHQEALDQVGPHELSLEAQMVLMVVRHCVPTYQLVGDFAPAGAEEEMAELLRGRSAMRSSLTTEENSRLDARE
jgi:hypothetical protein